MPEQDNFNGVDVHSAIQSLQQQLNSLHSLLKANGGSTQAQDSATANTHSSTEQTGTFIKDGVLQKSSGPLPSEKEGSAAPLEVLDPVEAYFSKRDYGLGDSGGVTKSPKGHSLEYPVSVAEMPTTEYPNSFEQEVAPDEKDLAQNLELPVKNFIELMIGVIKPATEELFADGICEAMSGILGKEIKKVSILDAEECFSKLLDTLEDSLVRDSVVKSAPGFFQYIEGLSLKASNKLSPSKELADFLDGIDNKDQISSDATRVTLTTSGGNDKFEFAKGVLIYLKDNPGKNQFLVLGGPQTNPNALSHSDAWLSEFVSPGDIVLLNAQKDTYDIMYRGHEIDEHNNLVVHFNDGKNLEEPEESLPDLSTYGLV